MTKYSQYFISFQFISSYVKKHIFIIMYSYITKCISKLKINTILCSEDDIIRSKHIAQNNQFVEIDGMYTLSFHIEINMLTMIMSDAVQV
jgi:hypothetical protein